MHTLLDLGVDSKAKLELLALAILQLAQRPDLLQPFPAEDYDVRETEQKIIDLVICLLTERGAKIALYQRRNNTASHGPLNPSEGKQNPT